MSEKNVYISMAFILVEVTKLQINSVVSTELGQYEVAATEFKSNSVIATELILNLVGATETISNSVGATELKLNSDAAAELNKNAVHSTDSITTSVIGILLYQQQNRLLQPKY